MKKHVWILNHYAGNMFFDKGGRHYNFAKYLRRMGYEPVIFCCNAKHGQQERFYEQDTLWHEHLAEGIETPFVFVRGRTYTGNGKQRILNMIDFYRNVQKAAKEYAKQHGKPDVIYASSVHPLTLVAGEQLAKYFGVKCICEARDLWPEMIVVYSERFTKKNPLIRLLYQGEKWIYRRADSLIFTIEGGTEYLVDHGWDTAHGGPIDLKKVFYINNGVDMETFRENQLHCQVEDPDLEDPNTFKVIYTGSIRVSNGLELLLSCAEKLQSFPDIRFLVYGKGEDLERLMREKENKALHNIVFKGSVPKYQIPYILSKSNLNLLNYAVEDVSAYQYGCSQNKLFEYLASGKPVLSNISMNYDILQRYHCGYSGKISSSTQYAEEILKIYRQSPEEYSQLCANSLTAASDYDFKNLTDRLIQVIER